MELTTLAAALLLALGLLGANAVIHANSVIVEVTAPPKTDKLIIDQDTLEHEFTDQLFAIANTASVVEPPEIHASRDQGIGAALRCWRSRLVLAPKSSDFTTAMARAGRSPRSRSAAM